MNIIIEYLSNIWYIGDSMPRRYENYNHHMKKFEKKLSNWYPYGNTVFCIDHGKNYFSFFRRLGEPFYYALFKENDVVGTICYIHRKINNNNIFYICDLKFDPQIRKQGNLTKIIFRTIPECLLITNKFYAISMNESENQENTIWQIAKHIGSHYNISINNAGILNIYSLPFEKIIIIDKIIKKYKSENKIGYFSLDGIKNLLIKNNNNIEIMKLVHLCYNKNNEENIYYEPLVGYTHMFCTLKTSVLTKFLESCDIKPSATATIISYNMENFNWEFVQTCDI
jgi:hypothetical protein